VSARDDHRRTEPEAMRRRDFVRRLPVLGAGVAAALSAGACAGVSYVVPRPRPDGALALDAGSLGAGEAAFVQGPGMERPVYVHRDDAGGVTAVLASCTHRGCQPEPVADRLVCPCHGSEFTLAGEVLQGPAERPLARYDVTEEGGELIVWVTGRRDR
jgi:nitrite reductase/ring-hydroxylating ferredoxin subunit